MSGDQLPALHDDRPPARTATRHQLRPGDIDAWGHLNHAKALELLELGRYDWVSARYSSDGNGYGCLPVVTRIDVSYRREILLAEVLVTTELKETRHYTAEFLQTVAPSEESHQSAIVGRIWLSFIDAETRQPMRVRNLSLLR